MSIEFVIRVIQRLYLNYNSKSSNMGANGLETAHNQQQLDLFLQQLEQKYLPLDGQNGEDEDVKWLVQRSTRQHFVYTKMQTNSEQQAIAYNEVVIRKMESPCQFVTRLYRYVVHKTQQTCNTRIVFYLLFNMEKSVNLSNQIVNRSNQRLRFSENELIEGLKSLIKAILWHNSIVRQSHLGITWNICPQNVYYNNGQFCVSDPWISQYTTQQTLKYPSHQRLMFITGQTEEFDRDAQLVFEAAMTVLQAAKLKNMSKVYFKNTLNLNLLRGEVQQSGYPQLKEILRQLLLGGIDKRRQYLLNFDKTTQSKQKEKIVRFQKHKMLNRVQSNKKIKLAKYQNQNLNTSFQQTVKQTPIIRQIEQRQPLKEKSKNTHITFSYKPYLNAQKLDLRPIQNQIESVHRCIEKINKNLQNIQNLVSQQLTTSSVQDVVESKIIASNKEQSQMIQIAKESHENGSHSKIDMPQTHTEASEVKSNKQLCQKDSLHVLMEQFQEDGEPNRLTQSYNEATYTVNVNQPQKGTSEPISRDERQESSLQIRDYPSDETCGYIFKMQGTQLQGVSKLTIPQEQPEEEESFQEGMDKTPKGEYVVHKNEKGGIYKGYMHNNKRNGLGTFYYLQGGYYEGNWKDNKMNGYGKIYYDSGQLAYQGMWYQDQIHGRGKLYNDSPTPLSEQFNYKNFEYQEYHAYEMSYEGDFSHDLKQGFGKLTLSNGESYSGEFHENNPHGKGYFYGIDGSVYGLWQHGIFIKPM